MRQVKLEAIFKEYEQKLKKFKLKSDPVDSNKPYVGYMLSEKPQITLEFVGSMLKSVGGGLKKAEQYAKTFRQIGEGDLGKLEDIGNALLDRLYDKMTGNALKFGKKGYTRVNLNDETIVNTLNEYAKNNVKKESFLTKVNENIFSFLTKSKPKVEPQKEVKKEPFKPQQLELPLKIKEKPKTKRQRQEYEKKMAVARNLYNQLSYEEKIEMRVWMRMQLELRGVDLEELRNRDKAVPIAVKEQKTSTPELKNVLAREPDLMSDLYSDIEVEDTPENGTSDSFNESNLIFNTINQKKFGRGTQFLLKPASEQLTKLLKDIGVYQVTIFRPEDKDSNTNTLDVYFYSDAKNVIPQLMFSGLKYAFDDSKKAYTVNSKIAAKKLPVVFKSSLPVPVNSVDIVSKDDANKVIRFNFKPYAFTPQSGLANYKDKFSQPSQKRNEQGEIFASVTAPFQYSVGKDFYILDLSRMGVNFDRNSKFYNTEQLKQFNQQPATATATKQPGKPATPTPTPKTSAPKQTKLKL